MENDNETINFSYCEHGVYNPTGAHNATCAKCAKEDRTQISKEQARINILEWLYTHDGGYPNKLKWREDFITMLKWNLKRIDNADKQ